MYHVHGARTVLSSRQTASPAGRTLMATCPHCKRYLTEGHRCSRRPWMVTLEAVACALGGGILALLLLAVFDPRGQVTDMDTVTFAAGALLAVAVNRALRS